LFVGNNNRNDVVTMKNGGAANGNHEGGVGHHCIHDGVAMNKGGNAMNRQLFVGNNITNDSVGTGSSNDDEEN